MGIELTNQQIFATLKGENWFRGKTSQVFEIAGAAGTGKTTLVRYLIDRLGLSMKNVLFVAFMGKAVSQLAKQGLPAKTLHSTIYNYRKIPVRDENGLKVITPSGYVKMKGIFELKDSIYEGMGKDHSKIKLIVLDEAGMVDTKIAEDLLSFHIPVIALGDLNQLPPVFGKPYFLKNPDVVLTEILRQKEGDPIVYLSQRVLHDEPLIEGVYGRSSIIRAKDLSVFQLEKADIVLTATNSLRKEVNDFYRHKIKQLKTPEFPYIGEKVICRKNNWERSLAKDIYLTNGTSGIITYVDRETFNGKNIRIDFKSDFAPKELKNIKINYDRLMGDFSTHNNIDKYEYQIGVDEFEFAYAISTHLSQGSEWDNVIFLREYFGNKDTNKRLWYTAITRARKSLTIVLQ